MSMGFLVEECIYVDDSEKGVEAGVNAEVPTFQLAPLNPNARSKDSNVVVINSLLDLKIWLSERCGQKNEYAYNW